MYEYSIEVTEIPTKIFKQVPNAKDLDGLLTLINKKAEEGWELVATTHMGGDSMITSFVCTFKKEKK